MLRMLTRDKKQSRLSVRFSVRLTDSSRRILSKRLNISLKFYDSSVAPPF